MASQEHLKLAEQIKYLHKTLRESTKVQGACHAWAAHLKCEENLQKYAEAMKELATKHWERNGLKDEKDCSQRNRILWSVNYCHDYFNTNTIRAKQVERELRILQELGADTETSQKLLNKKSTESTEFSKIRLLDVGSCYNPFNSFAEFEVTAIDIAPAVEGVLFCDFLNVPTTSTPKIDYSPDHRREISHLPNDYFDVVVFSLLLEYFPTSQQRIACCQKAYSLLKTEGILIIITPDSNHVGINAKLMKNWRYTLALMGFSRIKYEKLEHISCMVFRKSLNPDITKRWARIYKEEYMEEKIEIPQDTTKE